MNRLLLLGLANRLRDIAADERMDSYGQDDMARRIEAVAESLERVVRNGFPVDEITRAAMIEG